MCLSAVADTVIVTSNHNEDNQYIWESNASEFSIVEDPRGPTLLRGTTVSLALKDEAMEFLEPHTLRGLVEKYSQFINFPIYLWESKVWYFWRGRGGIFHGFKYLPMKQLQPATPINISCTRGMYWW